MDDHAELEPYAGRYLLVVNIPVWTEADGQKSVPPLWYLDLARHVPYLPHLTLAAPARSSPNDPARRRLDGLGMRVTELPPGASALGFGVELPRLLVRLFGAVRASDVVHVGVAGWPVPLGWVAAPLALALHKRLVVVVESAPWRTHDGSLGARVRARVFESMARFCVRRADLSVFTQAEYKTSLLSGDDPRGHVLHASWIDSSRILSTPAAMAAWEKKLAAPKTSFLFAGRLTAAKGVEVLLRAAELLATRNAPIRIDILGEGELAEACRARAGGSGEFELRVLGTLPYDASFFAALGEYHAVLVPSLGDEQPRIVYDAYAQAVPVLASDTAGLRDCVQAGTTGLLVPPGDAAALADAMLRLASARTELRDMGVGALDLARSYTHETMHARRASLLQKLV